MPGPTFSPSIYLILALSRSIALLDEEGKPLPVTQRYSEDVGKVLATVEGATATYRPTGEGLYVRAVVTSGRAPANPSFPDRKARASTRPVGWEGWVVGRGDARGRPLADPHSRENPRCRSAAAG